MEIRTLENTSITEILDCFNEAFSDYLIPTHISLPQIENKILSENIFLEHSIGVFDKRLVGFILHGYDVLNDRKTLYNAGTGVIPEYRGQRLTEKMYSFGLSRFKAAGIKDIVLEVITENHRAIKVYKRIGFDIKRTLNCYKGEINVSDKPAKYTVHRIESCNCDELKDFWNVEPTWQNSIRTIIRNQENQEMWGVYENENLISYLIYSPDRKRVPLFAVKPTYRRQGLASALFSHVAEKHDAGFTIVNLDSKDIATDNFLRSIGLHNFLMQYEMYLSLE